MLVGSIGKIHSHIDPHVAGPPCAFIFEHNSVRVLAGKVFFCGAKTTGYNTHGKVVDSNLPQCLVCL